MTDVAEISKNTIRSRAVAFSKRWEDGASEHAQEQMFWIEFFALFDVDMKAVGKFQALAKRASTRNRGWIDMLYPNNMAIEHKSLGEGLGARWASSSTTCHPFTRRSPRGC